MIAFSRRWRRTIRGVRSACLCYAALSVSASASAQQWSTTWGGDSRCIPIHRADAVALWIIGDDNKTAVEGSMASAKKRGDEYMSHLFFDVSFDVDRPISRCMQVKWRVEPWGPHPVDAADFGGRFPAGTMDLFDGSDHDEVGGAIQIWVPDDHIREGAETFRIVLLDPSSNTPLAGTFGAYDPKTGMRARHSSRRSLDMKSRLIMTVLDAPEQAARQ